MDGEGMSNFYWLSTLDTDNPKNIQFEIKTFVQNKPSKDIIAKNCYKFQQNKLLKTNICCNAQLVANKRVYNYIECDFACNSEVM